MRGSQCQHLYIGEVDEGVTVSAPIGEVDEGVTVSAPIGEVDEGLQCQHL